MKKEYKTVSIEEIKPYENNPRLNDDAVDSVVKSIQQCGYIAPIIVDEDMVVLAGHTRLKALKRMKHNEVDIIVAFGLSEEQKRKYRLYDNKTGELAEWDFDKLADEIEGLDFGDLDLDWGLPDEPQEVVEDDFEPELPEEPVAKLGDLFLLGRHRLLCGDSTMQSDVDRLVNGAQVDLFLTDPPYGVDYTGGNKMKLKNDSLPDEQFLQFLTDAFGCADSVMKPGACFYIWHADSRGFVFRQACRDVGWEVRQCLIWNKSSLVMGRQDYQWKHEPCLYGWKDGASHLWASDRKQTTVLNFERPSKNEEHPTMKPVKLFDYQMCNNTKGGDIVLDLFGGSGTAIIAAEQNGRTCYTMELDPRYVDTIIERYVKFKGPDDVFLVTEDGKVPYTEIYNGTDGKAADRN